MIPDATRGGTGRKADQERKSDHQNQSVEPDRSAMELLEAAMAGRAGVTRAVDRGRERVAGVQHDQNAANDCQGLDPDHRGPRYIRDNKAGTATIDGNAIAPEIAPPEIISGEKRLRTNLPPCSAPSTLKTIGDTPNVKNKMLPTQAVIAMTNAESNTPNKYRDVTQSPSTSVGTRRFSNQLKVHRTLEAIRAARFQNSSKVFSRERSTI